MKDMCKYTKHFDHPVIRVVLIVILVVYCSGLIKPVNRAVSQVVKGDIVKLIVIIVIALSAMKDPVLAILLTLALVLSLNTNEFFTQEEEENKTHTQEATMPSQVATMSSNTSSGNMVQGINDGMGDVYSSYS